MTFFHSQKPQGEVKSKSKVKSRIPAWGSWVRMSERFAAAVHFSRDNPAEFRVGILACAVGIPTADDSQRKGDSA